MKFCENILLLRYFGKEKIYFSSNDTKNNFFFAFDAVLSEPSQNEVVVTFYILSFLRSNKLFLFHYTAKMNNENTVKFA